MKLIFPSVLAEELDEFESLRTERRFSNLMSQRKKRENKQESGNENATQRYRDRTKERRDGVNPDYHNEEIITFASSYRAVAPDAKPELDTAKRSRQTIQEFKFLGGDMEHIFLGKGSNYALLQKVCNENNYKKKG
ncbi:protein Red [Nephila pilipes]|uniref:Protein Red n=1 Tax=Nephila pilipes TaxID=299642 RepID=A0A8X6MR66_NEPPI|nr:protein Red [Nephila pilipes]